MEGQPPRLSRSGTPTFIPISLATSQSDNRKPSNRVVVVPRLTAITKGLPFVILRALRGL